MGYTQSIVIDKGAYMKIINAIVLDKDRGSEYYCLKLKTDTGEAIFHSINATSKREASTIARALTGIKAAVKYRASVYRGDICVDLVLEGTEGSLHDTKEEALEHAYQQGLAQLKASLEEARNN